eukprot:TRINITY_DN3916_c0_g1_i1.p1 TRINITY_DN3916_c0_g1~~TRINITY_DN3916_c0_g1_i1.p1  ORF type:complete len:519 (+),score=163.61 TRINITY_DN3916_c0_g1_i1:124-1680(+)
MLGGLAVPAVGADPTQTGYFIPVKQPDNKDSKTTLNYFVQRYAGRMLLKGDVVYKSGKVSGTDMYQATVQLFCLDGAPVFAGELCREKKAAEQEAAKQALAAYAEEVDKMHEDPQCFKKQRQEEKKATRVTVFGEVSKMAKTQLFELLAKYCHRTLSASRDILFTTERMQDLTYISKLQMPCLEDKFPDMEFVGEPARSVRDAEHMVAQKVLDYIVDDPEFVDAKDKIQQMEERNKKKKEDGQLYGAHDKDPKTYLQAFVQRFVQKPIDKGDIQYTTIQVQGEDPGFACYQSTLQLITIEDQPCFAGEVAGTKKEAEFNAARVAIESYKDEIEDVLAAKKKRGKKRGVDGEEIEKPPEPVESKADKKQRLNSLFPYKGKLLELVMKIVRKAVTKEDINWVTEKDSQGKYICTLKIPCMPGHWSRRTWKGLPHDTVKEAEMSTSQKAFDQIRVDPSYAQEVGMIEQGRKITPKRQTSMSEQQNKGRGKGVIDLRAGRSSTGGVRPRMSSPPREGLPTLW